MTIQLTVDRQAVETKADELLIDLLLRRGQGAVCLADELDRMEDALKGVYRLALGGTAVGTGINSAPGFAEAVAVRSLTTYGLCPAARERASPN